MRHEGASASDDGQMSPPGRANKRDIIIQRLVLPRHPWIGMDSGVVGAQISNGFSLHRRGPISTTSLDHVHISEALFRSDDNGATLDFSHKGLTDVKYGAEQLATIRREDSIEDESFVLRCALLLPASS